MGYLARPMELSPTEVVNLASIPLNSEVTKGLVPAQVEHVKESVVEINDELNCVGQSLRAVAASLSDIKSNIKPGNWRAFLKSGAINCSERFAIDLVSAYSNWLGGSDIEDNTCLLNAEIPGPNGREGCDRQRAAESIRRCRKRRENDRGGRKSHRKG